MLCIYNSVLCNGGLCITNFCRDSKGIKKLSQRERKRLAALERQQQQQIPPANVATGVNAAPQTLEPASSAVVRPKVSGSPW